ncbi:unnamed protein product [Caenorhabditis nigoni]
MRRSIAILSVLLVSQTSGFLFGGGCCQAPVMQSPCCGGATSWAYAPPQVIGYERIPLYAKVPMPAPPTYVQPPPQGYVSSQPVAPQEYQQGPPPQQPQGYMGQVEQGIEVTPDQINSGYQPHQGEAQAQFSSSQGQFAQGPQGQFAQQGQQFDGAASDIASQSTGLVQSVANNAAFESAGIAPSARRLRKFKN